MESLPPTIYIAFGTIIAAFVSAGISIVSVILSKELKLSELRQNWIDELRTELSTIVSLVNKLAVSWYITDNKSEVKRKDFLRLHLEDIQELDAITHKLLMRLNPSEHQTLIEQLKTLEKFSSNVQLLEDRDSLDGLFNKYTDESNRVLKAEWVRVKNGEGSFKTMKTVFKSILVFCAISFILVLIIA